MRHGEPPDVVDVRTEDELLIARGLASDLTEDDDCPCEAVCECEDAMSGFRC